MTDEEWERLDSIIHRQDARIAELEAAWWKPAARIMDLTAQRDRYREALERIAEDAEAPHNIGDNTWMVGVRSPADLKHIARTALGEE